MSSIQSIHHINFLVKELQPQIDYFQSLLQCKPIIEHLPSRDVKTARFPLGATWIVLVQPLSEEGEVARILSERGEGVFLLSLNVDSLSESIKQLAQSGIKADEKGKRNGLDNWLVQDLQCPASLGSIIQLCQSSK
tara:strand:+ start:544 stop:951 length:408 start_codon:yes stop_codon:yes gene_type:complete